MPQVNDLVLVFILNAACSAEKQQIPLVFGLTDLM
jgi:hypothetical protein